MKANDAVRASLALLSPKGRSRLGLVTVCQVMASALDLAGILLIGIVATLAISMSGSGGKSVNIGKLGSLFPDVSPENPILLVKLAALAAFLLLLKTLISFVLTRYVLRFLARQQAIVSTRMMSALLSQPSTILQASASQETAYALTTGVNYALLYILGQALVGVAEIGLLIFIGVGLLFISPMVTIFAIVYFALLAFFLQKLMSSWALNLGRKATSAEVDSIQLIQDSMRSYREIHVTNRHRNFVDRFAALRDSSSQVQGNLQLLVLIPKYVFEVSLLVGAGLLVLSQLRNSSAASAIGLVAVYLAAGSRVVPSLLRLQGAALSVRSSIGQAMPTFTLAEELKVQQVQGAHVEPRNSVSLSSGIDSEILIECSHVGYTHPGAQNPTLVDVTFGIAPGASVAIVGPTGAGKSTLADLLIGVLEPSSGFVHIGGKPARTAVGLWSGKIGFVPQDVALLNSTIRENVAFGLMKDVVSDEQVWSALETANLAEIVRSMPRMLDENVGEYGSRISGGQRQRLGLARALYSKPEILILDEATSALDSETEAAIAQAISALKGKTTVIAIAHRLVTIKNSDLVIYLESGGIGATGTFEEVRAMSSAFDRQATLLGL